MEEKKNKLKNELLERYDIQSLIDKINEYKDSDMGWKLSDLVEDNKDYYYLSIRKGFIISLLQLGYIEIFCNFGNQQYIFKTIKKIEL